MRFLIAAAGSSVITYFTCYNCRVNATSYGLVTLFSFLLWMSLWIGNENLVNYLSRKISWVKFPVKRFLVSILATVIYTISVVMVLVFIWENVVGFRFDGYLEVIIPALLLTLLISFFLHGRQFLLNWKQSELNAEKLHKERVQAQYDALKSQVNPHFLFNSLNALTNLVYEDQDKAAKFIKQLSDVYRYVLDSKDKEIVPLADELRFLESYLFLQRIRFGEKLTAEITLHGTITSVAPLALQMLVENAIKHNEISIDNPLHIKVYADEEFLIVENAINRKTSQSEPSSGMGLENIRKRYDILSTRKVEVLSNEKKFIVKLPFLNIE
jgi:sensor histidine kinase YesM